MSSPEEFTPKPEDSKTTQTVLSRYDGQEPGVYEEVQPEPETRNELEAELVKIFSGNYELNRADIPAVVGDLINVIGGGVRIDGDNEIYEWSETVIDKNNRKYYYLDREHNEWEYDDLHAEIVLHDIEWHYFQTGKLTQDDVHKPLYTQVVESEPHHLSIREEVTNPRGYRNDLIESGEIENANTIPLTYQHRFYAIETKETLSILKDVFEAYKAEGTIKTQTELDSIPAEDI